MVVLEGLNHTYIPNLLQHAVKDEKLPAFLEGAATSSPTRLILFALFQFETIGLSFVSCRVFFFASGWLQ